MLPISIPAVRVQQATRGLVKLAGFTPAIIRTQAAKFILNHVFAEAIEDGDLDFLIGRILVMRITDANFSMAITAVDELGKVSIRALDTDNGDAEIRGELQSFVQLGAKTVDADTLFFQRKLVTEGDTALGLEFKNLTDAFDLSILPSHVREGLNWLAVQHS